MRKESLALLRKMLAAPSPSGFEQPVQKIVRAEMKEICDDVQTDVHGNVTGIMNADGKPRVMLAGQSAQRLAHVRVDEIISVGKHNIVASGKLQPIVSSGTCSAICVSMQDRHPIIVCRKLVEYSGTIVR